MKSERLKIKIEYQRQANKPIYLLHNGSIICGAFQYNGSKKKELRAAYSYILDRAYKAPNGNILDVSKSKFWDAPTICDEIIDRKIQATISARKIYKLACETEVRLAIAQIIQVFKDAVHLKWQKVFRKAPGDKTTPKNSWEIL
jgi:hypothetical protein